MDAEKDETLFMWSVQSLAQDASVQVKLFPDYAEVADELVLEHEQYQNLFLQSDFSKSLSKKQVQSINELDSYIKEISQMGRSDLWTILALQQAPEWDKIRSLSKQLIRKMKWLDARPPSSEERGSLFFGGG